MPSNTSDTPSSLADSSLAESLLAGVAVALVAGVAYLRTLMPGVGPTDSGELALAAWSRGVAHAPGMPGYILIAWAWTHLVSAGSVAWRTSLLSAASSALTAGVLTFASYRLAREVGNPHRPALAAAACAGLAIACGSDIWQWAVVTEVYAFNAFVVAAVLAVLLLTRPSRSTAMAAGALFGLGVSVHYFSTLIVAPLAVAWIVQRRPAAPTTDRSGRSSLRLAAWGAGAALAVVVPLYVMVMIRARQQPLVNWGVPDTPARLWRHVTAAQYRANVGFVAGATWDSLVVWMTSSTPVATVLGIWGWWTIQRRTGRWGWAVAAATAIGLFAPYGARFAEVPDLSGYVLPLQLLIGLAIPAGLLALAERAAAWDWRRERARARRTRKRAPAGTRPAPRHETWALTAPLAACVLVLVVMPLQARRSDRSRDTRSSDYVTNAVGGLAGDALVVAGDWELVSPLSYRQALERFRPDVVAIDFLLWQNRPWYVDQVARRHPDMAALWQPSLDRFLVELRRFEASELYDHQRIGSDFRSLMGGVLRTPRRTVYIDLVAIEQLVEKGMTLPNVLVPDGLLFRVSNPSDAATLAPLRWRLDSMLDPTLPHNPEVDRIALTYVSMLEARARYLRARGSLDEARQAADLAQRMDRRGLARR
jgi:Protein O-mannosyl-transferase TMEM260-like